METVGAENLDDFEDITATFLTPFYFHVISEASVITYYYIGKAPDRADAPTTDTCARHPVISGPTSILG